MSSNLDAVTSFLELNATLSTDQAAYEAVLHPEVEQVEYPNLLNKSMQRRSLEQMLDNIRLGRELLVDNQLEVLSLRLTDDGSVVMLGNWQAVSMVEVGPLFRGQRLTGHLCQIFEFKDGLIFRQHCYHCHNLAG